MEPRSQRDKRREGGESEGNISFLRFTVSGHKNLGLDLVADMLKRAFTVGTC